LGGREEERILFIKDQRLIRIQITGITIMIHALRRKRTRHMISRIIIIGRRNNIIRFHSLINFSMLRATRLRVT
jgi:3-phenylpropionate/cinnamic acid dioxygenase small subunit